MIFSEMQGRPDVAARKMGNHTGLPLRFGCGFTVLYSAVDSSSSLEGAETFIIA
jgi:hypothetical protein